MAVGPNNMPTPPHFCARSIRVVLVVFGFNIDLDIQDLAGNTPLHKAVEHDALEALECLLTLCVKTGVLNEKKLAPVHLATEMNRVNALKIMGRHRHIIDIQKGGEHGRTALHLAAIHDHEECARILVGWVKFLFNNIRLAK